jgi:hypothetical protein
MATRHIIARGLVVSLCSFFRGLVDAAIPSPKSAFGGGWPELNLPNSFGTDHNRTKIITSGSADSFSCGPQ